MVAGDKSASTNSTASVHETLTNLTLLHSIPILDNRTMSKVLATGVTGYIGGHMFDHFVEAHPNEEYTIYGRSTEKLQKVKDAYPKVKISTVTGSLTDKDILEKAAYEAEIVFRGSFLPSV